MEEEKQQSGQELLDVDDQGNYNENKKGDEKKKSSNMLKCCLIFICLGIILGLIYFCYCKKKSNKTIYDKTQLKNMKLKSRVFFGPILDDTFKDGKITEKAIKKYETLAKNNVALITPEGMMVGDSSFFPLSGRQILKIDNDGYIEVLRITKNYQI